MNDELYVYMIVNKDNYKFMNSNMFCEDSFNIINGIKFLTKDRAIKYLSGLSIKEDYKVIRVKQTIEECE